MSWSAERPELVKRQLPDTHGRRERIAERISVKERTGVALIASP